MVKVILNFKQMYCLSPTMPMLLVETLQQPRPALRGNPGSGPTHVASFLSLLLPLLPSVTGAQRVFLVPGPWHMCPSAWSGVSPFLACLAACPPSRLSPGTTSIPMEAYLTMLSNAAFSTLPSPSQTQAYDLYNTYSSLPVF